MQIALYLAQVNGGELPPHVLPFCGVAALLAACLPLATFFLLRASERQAAGRQREDAQGLDHQPKSPLLTFFKRPPALTMQSLLPSGIGFAVGMYVSPKWTIPRVIGSIIEQSWLLWSPQSHSSLMVVLASGLVLGEGTASILSAIIKAIAAA